MAKELYTSSLELSPEELGVVSEIRRLYDAADLLVEPLTNSDLTQDELVVAHTLVYTYKDMLAALLEPYSQDGQRRLQDLAANWPPDR